MKFVIFLFSFFILFKALSFDYVRTINGKRNIIKSFEISKSEKFVNFTLDGTFTDNLGNYGYTESSSIVILKNNQVVKLEGYGYSTYQNKEIIYSRGQRNQQEQDSGVGKNKAIGATGSLKDLIGMECTYAIKFFENYFYWLQKCNITEKQKEILINLPK